MHRVCYHAGPFPELLIESPWLFDPYFLTALQPCMLWDSGLWFSREVLLSAPFREEQLSECGPHARSPECRFPGSSSPAWSRSVGSDQGACAVSSSQVGSPQAQCSSRSSALGHRGRRTPSVFPGFRLRPAPRLRYRAGTDRTSPGLQLLPFAQKRTSVSNERCGFRFPIELALSSWIEGSIVSSEPLSSQRAQQLAFERIVLEVKTL